VKNVTELFGSTGALSATYDYSPFGQVTSFQITQSGNQAITQFSNPLTFSSEIHDSTLGLQYYNYRHLNVLDGRWVNRDPIGFKGGVNLYGMAENWLSNNFDILGLEESKKKCPCAQEDIDAEGVKASAKAIKLTEDKKNDVVKDGITFKVEFAGRVCCKLGDPKGTVYSTEPKAGQIVWETVEINGREIGGWKATSALSDAPSCNEGDTEVGIYHSHPTASGFSDADKLNKCIYLRKTNTYFCWRYLNGEICYWDFAKKEWKCSKEF
jgi:RHS repeat-associated protein